MHLEVISRTSIAMQNPKAPEGKNFLCSLATELQLCIVCSLPRRTLPTICLLNKHWRKVATDELLRRLLPIPPREMDKYGIFLGKGRLERAIRHFIDTNNTDALQRLLDFRPKHPYFRPPTKSLLLAEPASLRERVTTDEDERFFLGSHWHFCSSAVHAAFKYSDMSCMQLLIDYGLGDYRWLLDEAIYDACYEGRSPRGWYARPNHGPHSRGGHNSVLSWLLAYPPRHVVQAMLVMWGRLALHPRLLPLCDWCDPIERRYSPSCDNMLIVAAGRGHPASQQTIDELRMMVEILTDDASGRVIPEARQPLSHALRIARGMASMWPGTPPLVAEYLQSVCTWEDHQSGRGGCNSSHSIRNLPPPPLILPPQDPALHRLIDLKTYDEMLEPENWLELQSMERFRPLLWLVSTEFLADEDAAQRMRCFKHSLWGLYSDPEFTCSLLHAAGAFRRWRCVEVVIGVMRGPCPGNLQCFESPDSVLARAILDAVHGKPGCADGRIIRKLLRTGAKALEDYKSFGVHEDMPNDGPFRGGWFGWESFRLAFVERQQDREQRETPACIEMRDAVLSRLSISDQVALDFLVGEPSKALYRASKRRHLKRLTEKRDRGKGARGQGE